MKVVKALYLTWLMLSIITTFAAVFYDWLVPIGLGLGVGSAINRMVEVLEW